MTKQHLIEYLGLQGVNEQFQPAGDADVMKLGKALSVRLPDDYRHFLQHYGASLFSKDVGFTSLEASPWAVDGLECLDVFYGVSEDEGFDIVAVNSRLSGDIPEGTIAIGHDPGSNLILLSSETKDIRFFDKDSGKTYLVAPNFEAFLKSFRLR